MIVLAILLAGCFLVVAATLGLRKVHRFKYQSTRIAKSELESLASEGWQLQSRFTANGEEQIGLLRPPQAKQKEWVLFFPGNSGHLLQGHQSALDGLLGNEGYGLSFWAYRGFDASAGVPSPEAAQQDALDSFDWLRNTYGVHAEQIHLVGYSLGTCVASGLAASLAERGTPAGSLTLIAYADEIRVMQTGIWGSWKPEHRYNCAEATKSIPSPVLLLHGTDDVQLSIEEGRAVRSGLGEKATRIDVEGATHTSILKNRKARAALAAFLRK